MKSTKLTEYGTPANEGQLSFEEEMKESAEATGAALAIIVMLLIPYGTYKIVKHFYDRSPTVQQIVHENTETAKDLLH